MTKKVIGLMLSISVLLCGAATIGKPVYANSDVDISSKSAYLLDYNSGTVLCEKNAEAKLPVASMVKLMTLLLTYEEIEAGRLSLEDTIYTSENASGMGGSQVFIDAYEDYKVDDLLKSVIMASANDASVALAEKISGSEESFVKKMNSKAQSLKLDGTLYANCTGLPAPEQYSCAKDCAVVLKELYKYPHYLEHSNVWIDELIHPSGRKTELVNTNKLIRYYNGCDGGKTGSTNEAGYCLTASAKNEEMRLIAVVIGAKDGQTRFSEVSKLFSYGFANYTNKEIISSNISIKQLPVLKGKIEQIDIYIKESFYALTNKDENIDFDIYYDLPKKLVAPQKSGATIGKITINKDGQTIKEIDVIIKEDIKQLSYMDSIKKIAGNWSIKMF